MARGRENLFKAIAVAVPLALTVFIGLLIHKSRQSHAPTIPSPKRPLLPVANPASTTNQFFLYVLGGSTSKGEPFSVEDNEPSVFGRLVSWQFDHQIHGKDISVVTLAEKGTAIDTAAKMARDIIRQNHAPGTAAVLLYSGHNEFLSTDDQWDLTKSPRRLCDEWVVNPSQMAAILENHRQLTEKVITTCKSANIPIIVSTLACNLGDWGPNRSVLRNQSNSNSVFNGYQQATKAVASGNFGEAAETIASVLKLEPEFAELHFLQGRTFDGLGNTNAAFLSYRSAADNDGNPIRAVSAQNKNITELCRAHDVPLIDAPAIVRHASLNGVPGFDLFYDWVHPNLKGYTLIAEQLATSLAAELDQKLTHERIPLTEAREILGITDRKLAAAIARMAQICYVTSTRRWDPKPRLEIGRRYLREALELVPGNPDFVISQGMLELTAGKGPEAIKFLSKVYQTHPQMVEKRMAHPNVAQLFTRVGIPDPLARIRQSSLTPEL